MKLDKFKFIEDLFINNQWSDRIIGLDVTQRHSLMEQYYSLYINEYKDNRYSVDQFLEEILQIEVSQTVVTN